jgi:hypothetical protein
MTGSAGLLLVPSTTYQKMVASGVVAGGVHEITAVLFVGPLTAEHVEGAAGVALPGWNVRK